MSKSISKKTIEDTPDQVFCRVCNASMRMIHWKHLKQHEMTVKDYQQQFPEAPLVCEEYSVRCSAAHKEDHAKNPSRGRRQGSKMKNLWKSVEHRQKVAEGQSDPEAWAAMMEAAARGREAQKTPEAREKRSQIMLEKWQDEAFRESATSHLEDPQWREWHRNRMVEWYEDIRENRPEAYKKMMEKIRKKYHAWWDSLDPEGKNKVVRLRADGLRQWYEDLREIDPERYAKLKQAWCAGLREARKEGEKWIFSRPHQKVHALLEPLGFILEHPFGYWSLDEAHLQAQVAVEVDGCWWHACQQCFPGRKNPSKASDAGKNAYLKASGWTLLRIWEHEVSDPIKLQAFIEKVKKVLQGPVT